MTGQDRSIRRGNERPDGELGFARDAAVCDHRLRHVLQYVRACLFPRTRGVGQGSHSGIGASTDGVSPSLSADKLTPTLRPEAPASVQISDLAKTNLQVKCLWPSNVRDRDRRRVLRLACPAAELAEQALLLRLGRVHPRPGLAAVSWLRAWVRRRRGGVRAAGPVRSAQRWRVAADLAGSQELAARDARPGRGRRGR